MEKLTAHDKALDRLYDLTILEQERELTDTESQEYVSLYDYLVEQDIEIPFGVNI